MENELFEVEFYSYCKTCKYFEVEEYKDPCNECLENSSNWNTRKPLKWEEKE